MEDTPEARAKYQEYLAWRKRQKAKKQSLANIAADEEGYRATSGMTGSEKLRAGIGSGLLSVMDRAGNIVGAKGRFSDEAIAEKNKMEEDLLSTGEGAGGRLVGQIAATLPVGSALGAVAKGATALPGASRLASMAARVPGATGVARTGGAALEGAGAGALMSDPGEGGKAALTGGLISGGMGAAGQVGGKLLRALRPEATDAAKRVMARTGTHIPPSQALEKESLLRQLYSGVVANLPGQTVRKQTGKAVDAAREEIFSTALPHGVPVNSVFQSGDDTYTAMKHAKQVWETAFDDTNKAVVKGFDVPVDIAKQIRKNSPGTIIPETGKPITGRQMAEFKKKVNALASREKTDALNMTSKKRLWKLAETVDKRMYRDLMAQNARDQFGAPLWKQYHANTKNWNNWRKIEAAAKKAEGGEFTPQQWETLIRKSNVTEGVKDFADDAAKALPKFPSNQGPFQMVAAMSLLGGGGLGALSAGPDASIGERAAKAAAGAGSVYGLGRGLSSKPVQKALVQYGDKGLLDKYAQTLRLMGRGARMGAISEYEE